MKNIFLLFSLILTGLNVYAETPENVKFEPNVYALKISPNGKWIGSMAGNASIYNNETGEIEYYDGCFLGLGNTIANNGLAVGETNDVGVLMKNGEIIFPEALQKYWFCDINAITPDARRIVGTINNPNRGEMMYIPFLSELDADGNVMDPVFLPVPKTDLFNAVPQFITAVYISDDGKTILGQVTDWRGMFSYPICFQESENGEWNYSEPSKSLFNPTGIEIPENPWTHEPVYPEPENFMTNPVKKMMYETAYENFVNGIGEFPYPEDYMDEEDYQAYVDAVNTYNDWYYNTEKRIKDYIITYNEILATSPTFSLNDIALHPHGDFFMTHGGVIDENDEMVAKIFKFSFSGLEEIIEIPNSSLFPSQILSDGTYVVTLPKSNIPSSYVVLPGSKEFISIQELLRKDYPEISTWIDDMFPGGTGVVSFSEDMSVMVGGLMPDQLAEYDDENATFYYSSYIVNRLNTLGIESIVKEPENGIYRVYNLQGVKVLETKEASMINNLSNGIYLVNGKKVIVRK